MSELSRHLEFNKATSHSMLNELVLAGVLLRNPKEKTYGLGPTLVTWGVASAFDAYRALEFAENEMDTLRRQLDASCLAIGRVGNDLIVLARRDVDRPIPFFVPVGHRIPAAPPFGAIFYAWSQPDQVADWLSRLHDPTTGAVDTQTDLLRDIRERGYDIARSDGGDITELILELTNQHLPTASEVISELLNELQQHGYTLERAGRVDGLACPIFAANGSVSLALSVSSFAEPLDPDDVDTVARPLLAACRRVTLSLGGRWPLIGPSRPIVSKSAQ